MEIAVSCLTKFHAFNLAEQLDRHRVLARFYTSYAYQRNPVARLFTSRIDKEQIDPTLISTNNILAAKTKLRGPVFANLESFDQWVAKKLCKNKIPDVFIGWSGMSLHSIEQAKALGAVTILERGSMHMLAQMQLLKEEYTHYGLNFLQVDALVEKELAEYELADYISVPSSFAAGSFLAHGVAKEKLIVNPYGASSHFRSESGVLPESEKIRILYLGSISIGKGLIYLFNALDRLEIDYEAWFVGSIQPDMQSTVDRHRKSNWVFYGHINHYSLAPLIDACHIAVQPSIQEGLSMVIPQLVAMGLPVIATENTGVESLDIESQSIKIIPIRNPESIRSAILFYASDRKLLKKIRAQARKVQRVRSWDDYGYDYITNLNKIIKYHP